MAKEAKYLQRKVGQSLFEVLSSSGVMDAFRSAQEEVLGRHSSLDEGAKVQKSFWDKNLPNTDLNKIVTVEAMLALSNAVAYEGVMMEEGITIVRKAAMPDLNVDLTVDQILEIESLIDTEGMRELAIYANGFMHTLGKGAVNTVQQVGTNLPGAIARVPATVRLAHDMDKFKRGAKPVEGAMNVFTHAVGSLPVLIKNVEDAKKIQQQNIEIGEKIPARIGALAEELGRAQEKLKVLPKEVNDLLGAQAVKFQAFALNTNPDEIKDARTSLAKVNMSANEVINEYEKAKQLPDPILYLFNLLVAIHAAKVLFSDVKIETRGAIWATLTNELNALTVLMKAIHESMQHASYMRRLIVAGATVRTVRQAQGMYRDTMSGIADDARALPRTPGEAFASLKETNP